MSYSINKAMAGGYQYEKLSQPWFVEPGSQPSEEHAQIDRGLWAETSASQRKHACWRWYKLHARRTELSAGEKLALWAIVDTLNTNTGCSTLTQQGLADMVGMARSSAHRAMIGLVEKNVVWSYLDKMPAVAPEDLQAFVLKHMSKPERRQLKRHHVPVGLHYVLKSTFAD